MAIHELLPMTNPLREMIVRKASEFEIQQVIRGQGMKFLLEKGMARVREGTTTLSELFRVLQLEEQEATYAPHCPTCKAIIESDFAVCPNCLTSLKVLCQRCNQQLKIDWKICPYCKTPVSGEVPEPVRLLEAGEEGEQRPAGQAALTAGSDGMEARPASQAPAATPPREEASAEAFPSNSDSEPFTAPAKKPKILIVDDDPSIRLIVAKSLQQLPFEVGTELASDGLQAVEIAEREHPDLIVLDVMMPGMDGFGVCQKLRSQVETAFIPIMMLTANPSEEGRIRSYMVGSDDYVSKPFNVAELNARVTRLLRRAYGIS
jgi:CheY-like chemotaxis protein/RNA polymerase subunit RPABC4/transcription elongation factor Spt4